MRQDKPKPYLTSSEIAERLGVSRQVVFNWLKLGYIVPAFYTPGGHVRFEPGEADRLRGQPVNPNAIRVDDPNPDALTTDSHLWREIKRATKGKAK